jgi:FKBP-type peptidyl-prolyl cis-trans isomerase
MDGTIFDTSIAEIAKSAGLYNPGRPYEPYQFPLGTGSVIKGWDIGIGLLRPGAKGVLYLPSSFAYGERGSGPTIPPNAILIFDVELVEIVK